MKKYNIELELFEDWDIALQEEYKNTKRVLNKYMDYNATYEQFLSSIIRNIIESSNIYDFIDSYAEKYKDKIEKEIK